MLIYQRFDLLGHHVVFFPIHLGYKICFRNAKADEEAFGQFHAALGKGLIVFRGAAVISMTLEFEVGIGLDGEILLEVVGQRSEGLLLTLDQPLIRRGGQR